MAASERERQERLIRQLGAELERRRTMRSVSGTSLEGILGGEVPAIVLLLESYTGFTSAFEEGAGSKAKDVLTRILADGPEMGIFAVITAERAGAVPYAVAATVTNKLVFRLATLTSTRTSG